MGLNDSELNRYSVVRGAARRARQLLSGAPPLGAPSSSKFCRVAEDEVRSGKVTFRLTEKKTPPPQAS